MSPDIYCNRCVVYGHEEDSSDCHDYWNNHELPFRDRMYAKVGSIYKLGDPAPTLYNDHGSYDPPPGTFVRLTHYTPDTPGLRAGNYWSIQTLDGQYSATQIYQDELAELDVLDKLSLLKEDTDAV